jgi:signal transduction histidine kinase/Flp pilus assembly protein TadD
MNKEKTAHQMQESLAVLAENLTQYTPEDFSARISEISKKNETLQDKLIEMKIAYLSGEFYLQRLDIGLAIKCFFQAIELARQQGLSEESARSLNNLGVCYSALELYPKAIKFYRQSLQLSRNTTVLCNLADRLFDIDQPEEAFSLFEEALEMAKQNDDEHTLANIYTSLGDYYYRTEDFPAAKINYDRGLKFCQKSGDQRNKNFAYLGLGRIALSEHDYSSSKSFFDMALKIAEEKTSNELKWFTYNALIEYYEAKQDYKTIYHYMQEINRLKDKIFYSNIEQKIISLETAYALENQKLEAEKMLEQSSKLVSIGVMAAGITHEINQPLNTIAVNADGILFTNEHEKLLSPFYIDAVQQIYDASIKISEIIKHMRQFWTTSDYLENKPFDANNSILNALNLLNEKVAAHQIELNKSLVQKSVTIKGNSVHLEQIIVNLITNAIQALDESSNDDKIINLETEVNSRYLIRLSDNGVGLGSDNLDIFDPFYSTKSTESNMGLGLAIVQQLIKSMQGKITYYNNQSGGVSFEISLPYEDVK